MENLIQGLHKEMNRVRDLIKEYEGLPGGAGFLGASMMKVSIQRAETAIGNSDVIAELQAYNDLKGFTG